MTFSIVAKYKNDIGAGVVSGSTAVRERVPWVKREIGAIVTQGYTKTMYGKVGLELLEKKYNPEEILQKLLKKDNSPEKRQVAILSYSGKSVFHTGISCPKEKEEKSGKNYFALGNMLKSKNTVNEMGNCFEKKEGTLLEKIDSALKAGAENGGDLRGNKTAAIVIKGEKNVDLDVKNSETPLRFRRNDDMINIL